MSVLGLDCGGSGSRWVVLDTDGDPLARGTGPPLAGHLFEAAARQSAIDALRTLCADIRASGATIDAVVAGITGLSATGPEAGAVAAMLAAGVGAAPERVTVVNDIAIAYRAAFPDSPGILVYAGTGSVALHVAADGRESRAGGHGCMIDDAGSGFAIGQQALRWLMREADRAGNLPSGALAEALLARVGGRDWLAIRAYAYADSRRHIGLLALAVAEAAAAGDPVAKDILRDAGEALAALARALETRVGTQPVALSGRAAALHPLIFETFAKFLAPACPRRLELDPAEAAARMALTAAAG
ncbi:MAG: ATPase [Inquilinus sp.]|nr:ATPase [Inquilinus sp.]